MLNAPLPRKSNKNLITPFTIVSNKLILSGFVCLTPQKRCHGTLVLQARTCFLIVTAVFFKYLSYESSITLFTSLLQNLLHISLDLSSAHISEAKSQITFKPELTTINEILSICILTSFYQICLVSWFESSNKLTRERLNIETRQCTLT